MNITQSTALIASTFAILTLSACGENTKPMVPSLDDVGFGGAEASENFRQPDPAPVEGQQPEPAIKTMAAMVRSRLRCEAMAKSWSPTNAPTTRPAMTHQIPLRSSACRSRQTMETVRGTAQRSCGTGAIFGSSISRTGTDNIAKPKPIVACRVDATTITAKPAARSPGVTGSQSTAGYSGLWVSS